ncbi:uncharacterized protein ARMOST_14463 [Armillaria ostoyae]|uniref:DUF6535 domain-containing protein n=1 Tax=Armillaria ostoyae TaxID=47428 RepID=A0A284RQK9_ARMOS|nr:uncharacterized protein ARMOST_14463 [Armillaria ostoyae]
MVMTTGDCVFITLAATAKPDLQGLDIKQHKGLTCSTMHKDIAVRRAGGGLDVSLIFAGLFYAVVTIFVVQTSPNLQRQAFLFERVAVTSSFRMSSLATDSALPGTPPSLRYMGLEREAINLPGSSDNQLAMVGGTLACYCACRRECHRGTCHGMENVPQNAPERIEGWTKQMFCSFLGRSLLLCRLRSSNVASSGHSNTSLLTMAPFTVPTKRWIQQYIAMPNRQHRLTLPNGRSDLLEYIEGTTLAELYDKDHAVGAETTP